ncbi:hypothetical protein G7046_g5962 [Stylonectria norvegica]|nr:hypothetical protein G7046_g5962 [Stylonectria norvegica]
MDIDLALAALEYYVVSSPNEAENGFFSCPHLGCDGRTFDTSNECVDHEVNWHSGPYTCPECDAEFAAEPALARHARGSGHSIKMVCSKVGCGSEGVAFTSRGAFVAHLVDPAHQGFEQSMFEPMEETIAASRPDAEADPKPRATPGKSIEVKRPQNDYICREACCDRFGTDFRCKSEFQRHANIGKHILATKIGKVLERKASKGDLEAEQEAIRNLRCNGEECADYGKVFSTYKSYVHHIGKIQHRTGHFIDLGNLATSATEHRETVEVTEDMRCTELWCPRYGDSFRNAYNFKTHVESAAHVKAINEAVDEQPIAPEKPPVRHTTVPPHQNKGLPIDDRSRALGTPCLAGRAQDEEDTPEARSARRGNPFLTPLRQQDLANLPTPLSPPSPSAGRGQRAVKSVPRKAQPRPLRRSLSASAESRLDALEQRNKELEERNTRLEERLSKMEDLVMVHRPRETQQNTRWYVLRKKDL